MSDSVSYNSTGNGEQARHRKIAEVLWRYIDRLNAGERLDDDTIRSEEPELAEDLIRELETFRVLGSDTPDSLLGTLGDYTLRRQIGRGGMGVVYEAWENSMERAVALKVLPAGIAADPKATTRFLREAQTAGKLSHPNIVPVFFTGVKEQTPFYAMEFVEGETLSQILSRIKDTEPEAETPFGPKDRQDFFIRLGAAFADVADGLQHAHSKGVTHRDIKPSNLILDADGRLRILDFGLARLEGQESLTLSGDFVGTPLYMSPEQARRKKIPVDHRTDVYSLGATMYEAICGRPPFRGKDHADTLSQIIERDPVEPRKVNPRVPKDLETIVLKCLRKDARDRYGTAEALAQDLRRFVRGDPIEARPERLRDRGRRWIAFHGRVLTMAALALLVATLAGFLLTERLREHRLARRAEYEADVLDAVADLRLADSLHWDTAPYSGIKSRGTVVCEAPLSRLQIEERLSRRLAVLERVIDKNPDEVEARLVAARFEQTLGRTGESLARLRNLIHDRPDFWPARSLEAALRGGDRSEDGRRLNSRDESPEELWRRGLEAVEARHWNEAADAYRALIIGVAPEGLLNDILLYDWMFAFGVASLESGQQRLAERTFQAIRTLWPGCVTPAIFLAREYLRNREVSAAERLAMEELEILKSAGSTLTDDFVLSFAQHLFSLQHVDRALEWSLKVQSALARHRARAQFFYHVARYEDAKLEAEKAVASDPDDQLSRAILAQCCADLPRETERARALLDNLLVENPTDPNVLLSVIGTYHALHGPQAALELFQKRAGSRLDERWALMTRVHIYQGLERFVEGEALAHRLVSERPNDCRALNDLIWMTSDSGKIDKVLELTESVVGTCLELPWPHAFRGENLREKASLLRSRGDEAGAHAYLAEASASLQEALRLDPRHRWAGWWYARVLQDLGDRDGALLNFSWSFCLEPNLRSFSGDFDRLIAELLRAEPRPQDLSPLDPFLERFQRDFDEKATASKLGWIRAHPSAAARRGARLLAAASMRSLRDFARTILRSARGREAKSAWGSFFVALRSEGSVPRTWAHFAASMSANASASFSTEPQTIST